MEEIKVNDLKSLDLKIEQMKLAQKKYSSFSQKEVDEIFFAGAKAANKNRIKLAKMAVEETNMGNVEDKVIKNHFASEYIYNKYKDTKTVGKFFEDEAMGVEKIYEPIGIIGAIIPTTNPTSTAIFKVLMALKTRNAIFLAPHPRARKSTIEAAKIVIEAAEKQGLPKGMLGYILEPKKGVDGIELTNHLMKKSDIILATGGPGMVKAAYSSGTPAIGVGAGNTSALFDESCDVQMAVSSVIQSKSFDNGVICASEQSIVVNEKIYKQVKEEFEKRGAYILNKNELEKVKKIILKNGVLNSAIVGQSAQAIGKVAGIKVPEYTRIIIGEVEYPSLNEPFSHEKLSILLAMFKYKKFEDGLEISKELIEHSGLGHTSSIFIDELEEREKIEKFYQTMPTARVMVNSPSAQGGIGDIYNFNLEPSLTLGCGSWGNNAVSENVGPKHLLNIKTVAKRRENMLWFKIPQKVYFKYGSLKTGLKDLKDDNIKKVFLVTDNSLFSLSYHKKITNELEKENIEYKVFSNVQPDPSLKDVKQGTKEMEDFNPDCIIALGGGSVMDAAKVMRMLYEYPKIDFKDMAMTFMDMKKRIYKFPKSGIKAKLLAIPTSSGTGSEVTPFSVITDDDGTKYPLADYELTPDMVIVDPELTMSMPKGLTVASGIDVFTHAIESYVSTIATDYTMPYSLKSAKLVMENLENSVEGGAKAKKAKENMANASCMAGMAFANAFLGICHSMAHKLGAKFHIPHGIANALLLSEVIKYNATDKPFRMGTFSQYEYPQAISRYAEFASFIGVKGKDDKELVENLIKSFDKLKENIGIPLSIEEYGIKEKDFLSAVEQLSEDAFNDQCTGANPRYPKIEDLKEIYLSSYYKK